MIGVLLICVLFAGPLQANYFVNRLNQEIHLYPASGGVLVVEPNQCVRARHSQTYRIVYFDRTYRQAGERTSLLDHTRSSCHPLAGGKLQCTRYLRVPFGRAGAIWLDGGEIQTGFMDDFEPDDCFGDVRKL